MGKKFKMYEIRKSEFNPEKYNKLTLLKTSKNGNEEYEYQCACDRCDGKGYVISHIMNGQPVLMRPEGGICFKCRGAKVMTQKVKVVSDEYMDKKEAKLQKEAEEYRNNLQKMKEERIKHNLELGFKKVDFKIAGWFFGKHEDVEFNSDKYYLIQKESEKAVLIGYKDALDSCTTCEYWFPKKAIVR